MSPASPPSDEPPSQLRIEHTIDDETSPSVAIILAIAILEDTNPADLPEEVGMTLYEHIDPEALDRLITGETEGEVTIDFDLNLHPDHEYAVQIHDTRNLVVEKAG